MGPSKVVVWLIVFLVACANGLIQVSEAVDVVAGNETWGAGAAVFALTTALFLFITRLPKDGTPQYATVDTLSHASGVVTAFCAGLLWLWDENAGPPGAYLIVLVSVSGLLAFMFGGMIVFDWVRTRQRGNNP